jgi:hypothetical protein
MILFAYAGNMDVEKFSETVPSAKKLGVSKLPGYCFVFNKMADDQSTKANITRSDDPAETVWGVLIELNDEEKANFYDPDTWSSGLKLEPVSCIDADDNIYQAEAFFAQPNAINYHTLPYDWYHQRIIAQAKTANLPETYIDKIAAMNFKTDPDETRRQKRLAKIKR